MFVCSFPFGFEGGMWDFIILVPDHCLSFYFTPNIIITKSLAPSNINKKKVGLKRKLSFFRCFCIRII